MRVTLSMTFATAVLLVGCHSQQDVATIEVQRNGIHDFTRGRSRSCEIHRRVMSPKVVDLKFGMKPANDIAKARWKLFPHADEPYETGYCIRLLENRGRVFVCDGCTEARTAWINTHKPALR